MNDKGKLFNNASRNVGFKKGIQAVNLNQMFSERGIELPHGENEL